MSSSPGSKIPLFKIKVQEKGVIRDIKEVIVRVDGLPTCLYGQIVDLGDGVNGIIMGYDTEDVLVLAMGDSSRLRLGKEVHGVSEPFRVPVGDAFLGRMVTAMGEPCDHGKELIPSAHLPVFRDSPPITHRAPIGEGLETGTKIVDMLIPIGKGQRELILGDRVTGKTVIALDAILNQKGKSVFCIYCAIGKSVSNLEKTITTLQSEGALDYSLAVVATDNSPVGEQYIVPFTAATLAEYFAAKGHDVLVVFDDLTKHAWAYRQLSLLLGRPPGREAYPGDVFYVQTQLMERAGRFNKEHGDGSITFLGIAETLQGDLTGYIPSNLASMCDGQIFMSSSVFAEGFRPAIDVSLSLSIVGGRAQPPILKKLGLSLRSDYAKYKEVLSLSRLSSGVSDAAERVVQKGEAIASVLQQGQHQPVCLAEQVLLLYALSNDLLLSLSPEHRDTFRLEIYNFARDRDRELLEEIERSKEPTTRIMEGLAALMAAYFSTGVG
jgi:F-type H+-transporting ATPase subunit alpha